MGTGLPTPVPGNVRNATNERPDLDKLAPMKRFLRSRSDRRKSRRTVLAGEASAAAASSWSPTRLAVPPEPKPTAPAVPDEAGTAESQHASEGTVAAFFDVDNTMMRGASIYYIARGMSARDLFTTRDLLRFAWKQLWFQATGTESTDHINGASEAALAFVAGQKVDRLVSLAEEIYDELIAVRVWPGTRALARQHLEAGQRVWLDRKAHV